MRKLLLAWIVIARIIHIVYFVVRISLGRLYLSLNFFDILFVPSNSTASLPLLLQLNELYTLLLYKFILSNICLTFFQYFMLQ